nr:serine/threonine-protein kinase [Nannocystis sp. ILAH1]
MVRPDPKQWVGKTVGGVYTIKRHVASGGFAEVYEAWHNELDTPVAVKMRRPVGRETDSASQNARTEDYAFAHFKTEAILGFRLRDPNVVRVLDFRLEAKAEYLVMEWLDGQSLRDLQDGRPMYWRRATELTAAAAEAVASLHEKGWFHRDIKPDNFMVVGDGADERVVLIDLGLVRHRPLEAPIMSQLAEPTGWIPYTPGYCAPEVYARSGQPIEESPFTEASEVFALGVTLFKLLTARMPWPGTTAQAQQVEIALGVVPSRPSEFGVRLPTDLENLVMRAIGGDPAQRPASAAELGRQLRRLLEPSARKAAVPTARAPEPTPPAPALTPVTGLGVPIGPSPALARSSATTARPPVLPPPSTPAPPRPWVLVASLGFTVLFACTLLAVFLLPPDVTSTTAQRLDAQQLDAFEPVPVPTLIPVVQPAAAPAPASPTVVTTPSPPTPTLPAARELSEGEKRQKFEARLRRCPDAPSGLVMVEMRGGRLRTIELEPYVRTDPWHACAAQKLRGLADGQHALRL